MTRKYTVTNILSRVNLTVCYAMLNAVVHNRLRESSINESLRRRSVVYQGVPNIRTWKCIDRCKEVSGNGCLCDILTVEALFKKLYEELALDWNGLDNVTEEDFKNIERVDLFKGFKLKVTLREARETA